MCATHLHCRNWNQISHKYFSPWWWRFRHLGDKQICQLLANRVFYYVGQSTILSSPVLLGVHVKWVYELTLHAVKARTELWAGTAHTDSSFPLPCLRREATYMRMLHHQSTCLVHSMFMHRTLTQVVRFLRSSPQENKLMGWGSLAERSTSLHNISWWHCSGSPEHRGAHGTLLVRFWFSSTANSQAAAWAQKNVKAAPRQHGRSEIIFHEDPRERMASPKVWSTVPRALKCWASSAMLCTSSALSLLSSPGFQWEPRIPSTSSHKAPWKVRLLDEVKCLSGSRRCSFCLLKHACVFNKSYIIMSNY